MHWKAIPGWEHRYEVSEQGAIRSLDMVCGAAFGKTAIRRGRVLKQSLKGGRYLCVTLTSPARRQQYLVHDLVALAFIGPKPEGLQTCHQDDCKANNASENLRYGTAAENAADRELNGRTARGESSGNARLSEAQVRSIRSRAQHAGKALAAEFGITYAHLYAVISRRVWRHI